MFKFDNTILFAAVAFFTITLLWLIIARTDLIGLQWEGGPHSVRIRGDLPACNMLKLMQRSDFHSLVNWNLTTDVNSTDGITVDNCNLHTIDRDFARRVIRDAAPNGLVLIGDSLTRYQYLNLVNFLENGSWMTDPTNMMPSENEHTFAGGWAEFYNVTNRRLNGHEICDCYRNETFNPAEIIENRYYIHGDVKVSYLQLFGPGQILMHNTTMMNISSCSYSTCVQSFCQPGECFTSLLPVDNMGSILHPGTLSKMVASVAPSQVFLNAGLWWIGDCGVNNFLDQSKQTLLDELTKIKESNPNIQVHWKMTTASMSINPTELEFARHLMERKFARNLMKSGGLESYYDTFSLTAQIVEHFPSFFWDVRHFVAPVYKGLNQALIAYLWSLSEQ